MEGYSLSRRERKNLIRIVVALAAFAAIFIADKAVGLADVFGGRYGWLFPFALYLAVYLLIGYDVLWRAVRNIAHGQVFDENFLMCIATLGAFALAIYRGATGMEIEGFDEACAVLLFYQVGECSRATRPENRASRYPRSWTYGPITPTYCAEKKPRPSIRPRSR